MEEAMSGTYWCHICAQIVNPTLEIEIKCPFCLHGFVEEMGTTATAPDSRTDRSLTLWAPFLLGMMGNDRRHHHRARLQGFDDLGVEDGNREHESVMLMRRRRRRRSSVAILEMLQTLRAGMPPELENSENLNQTVIVHGSIDSSPNNPQNRATSVASFGGGNYLGLDLLLHHLAENESVKNGTPPARKDAVEAMPSVVIKEKNLQCSVCLDDFEMGAEEAKEMPCKHKYHRECILPWLELHSSCPVCRFEMPAEEEGGRASEGLRSRMGGRRESNENGVVDGHWRNRRRRIFRRFSMIPWLSNAFSSQTGGGDSSSSTGSSSST